MKRAERLIGQVADPDNLRLAAWKAAKGKRHSEEVLAWFANMELNILDLRTQILSGEPRVGDYRYFKVYEPKERQICASAFGEQVLHHALMNICHDHFERVQVFDSYASRKGKGTYAALERAKYFSNRKAWFLKLDVRQFFGTIHHDVLKDQLARMFKDAVLLRIFHAILESYAPLPQRGLPIGNLTSQYFANHFLCGLDHFILEKIQAPAYVRYMDDLVLWHDDQGELKNALMAIRQFVETQLLAELKPELLQRVASGLPFLGYHIFPHHVRLLQKSKQRFLKKMRTVDENYHSGAWSEAQCQRRALPLLAFAHHANTQNLQKNLLLRLKGQSP